MLDNFLVESLDVRQALDADWMRIGEICRITSLEGTAMPSEKHSFFEGIWVEPYRRLSPELTFVAVDRGRVAGYLTGCHDTAAFKTQRRWRVELPLGLRYLPEAIAGRSDVRSHWLRLLGLKKSPEDSFPRDLRARLAAEFPAHLHINVDPQFQSRGIGSLLIRRYEDELRRRGAPGVHLFCGQKPVSFYQRQGFSILERMTLASGAEVFCMGREIPR